MNRETIIAAVTLAAHLREGSTRWRDIVCCVVLRDTRAKARG